MATFDFPYHKIETEYPESGTQVEFGGGYVFAAKPSAPDRLTFVLHFTGMRYILDSNGDIDETTNPQVNMKVLQNFYETHKTWDTFTYPHPVLGDRTVRFKKPLKIPKGKTGGSGVLEDFQIILVEDDA